jgi:hypothetical protein
MDIAVFSEPFGNSKVLQAVRNLVPVALDVYE